MLAIEITPNLAAAQFMPTREQRRLDRLVSRIVKRNRQLHAAIVAARHEARLDQARHDAWLCAQSPQSPQSIDEDLPW